jgi:hypothetical protein
VSGLWSGRHDHGASASGISSNDGDRRASLSHVSPRYEHCSASLSHGSPRYEHCSASLSHSSSTEGHHAPALSCSRANDEDHDADVSYWARHNAPLRATLSHLSRDDGDRCPSGGDPSPRDVTSARDEALRSERRMTNGPTHDPHPRLDPTSSRKGDLRATANMTSSRNKGLRPLANMTSRRSEGLRSPSGPLARQALGLSRVYRPSPSRRTTAAHTSRSRSSLRCGCRGTMAACSAGSRASAW